MIVFEDWLAPPIKSLCHGVKSELRKWEYAFSTTKPNNAPAELPPDVDAVYEQTMRELHEEPVVEDE